MQHTFSEEELSSLTHQIHEELWKEVQLACPDLSPMLGEALWPVGKSVRSRVTLCVGRLFLHSEEEVKQKLIPVCKALECLHTASLLHDDVVDAGITRRHRPCLYHTWGQRNAILLGDYMLSVAFQYLLSTQCARVLEIFQHAMKSMATGQIQETFMSWNSTLDTCESIVQQKTASLFVAAIRSVCVLCNVHDHRATVLEQYAHEIGICFQWRDDVQDYSGGIKDKKQFQDFFQSRITAPVLWLMHHACSLEQNQIKTWWAHPSVERAHDLVCLMEFYKIFTLILEIIGKRKNICAQQLQQYWNGKELSFLINFFS